MATIDLKLKEGKVRVWDERVFTEYKIHEKTQWKKFEELTGLKMTSMSEPGFLEDVIVTFSKGKGRGKRMVELEGYKTKTFVTIHGVELLDAPEQPKENEEDAQAAPVIKAGDQVWVNFYKKDRMASVKLVSGDKVVLELNHNGKIKEIRKTLDDVKPLDFDEVF